MLEKYAKKKALRCEAEELLKRADPLEISAHKVIEILLTTGGPRIWIEIPDMGPAILYRSEAGKETIEIELSFGERRAVLAKYGIEDPRD